MAQGVIYLRMEDGCDQHMKELYDALTKRDQHKVVYLCQQKIKFGEYNQEIHLYKLPLKSKDYPLTTLNDTVIHIATYSGQNQLVRQLLDLICDDHEMLKAQNEDGDTILHEATTNEKIEVNVACKMLDLEEDLLKIRNFRGETPLFRAVRFGNRKMFDFLLDRIGDPKGYWIRNDGTNILHVAIQAESFDLAFEIAKKYRNELLDKRDETGMTGLQVLSCMPSAFKSGTNYKLLKRIIYYSVPSVRSEVVVFGKIMQMIWKLLRELPWMDHIWNEKSKHESAVKLAKYLVANDLSWKESDPGGDPGFHLKASRHDENEILPDHHNHRLDLMDPEIIEMNKQKQPETPLLLATSNGIVEIVREIINVFPQAIEHVSPSGQNILHVAVRNRQREIFDLVKKMKLPMQRLAGRIDKEWNTALHQVAFMENYHRDQLGPALQMGDELLWFKLVREVLPPHFLLHHNKEGLTADELFDKYHSKLLTDAQEWLKRTSESCSVVAVLIATVAFAAAYTVPGGINDKGEPVFLDKPFFLVFTVMDVVFLASSLTSVVMFLSILTSPFHLHDFKQTLQSTLTLGFTFLFMSVAAMMLAFAATIILTIQTKRQSTKLLIYIIAFLPVTIFGVLQLPLYMALTATAKYTIQAIKKALPRCSYLNKNLSSSKKAP